MKINRTCIEKVFDEYVAQYDITDTKVKLKQLHTFKVAALCETIAESINMNEDDVNTAWLSGMLHDIGRFEQLRRFDTFLDHKSINHAEFGADLLFKEGLIDKFKSGIEGEQEEFDLLELTIRCHNRLTIPEELSEREVVFCNILRDADKLDIFRVCTEDSFESIYNVTTEEKENSLISPKVLEGFYEHHAIDRMYKTTMADHVLGHMSMAYELVFPLSRKLCIEQGYLVKFMKHNWRKTETSEEMDKAKEELLRFLSCDVND